MYCSRKWIRHARHWVVGLEKQTTFDCGRRYASNPSSDSRDHYQVLGLQSSASAQDIKKAFYSKSKQFHPDAIGSKEESSDEFLRVNEAYQTLGDPKLRDAYDLQLTEKRNHGSSANGNRFHNFDSQAYSEFYRKRRKSMEEQGFRPRPDPVHMYTYRSRVAQPNREKLWKKYEQMTTKRQQMIMEERRYLYCFLILIIILFLIT
jgi:DnaJ-class molecular chaperone